MRKIINSEKAPKAVGPYSQANVANGFCYVSGQLGLVPETGVMAGGDVEAQARQALTNVRTILDAAGSTMDDVVKVTMFLTDMNDFAKVNEIYAEFFNAPYPARSAFQVAALPKEGLVEFEVVAIAK